MTVPVSSPPGFQCSRVQSGGERWGPLVDLHTRIPRRDEEDFTRVRPTYTHTRGIAWAPAAVRGFAVHVLVDRPELPAQPNTSGGVRARLAFRDEHWRNRLVFLSEGSTGMDPRVRAEDARVMLKEDFENFVFARTDCRLCSRQASHFISLELDRPSSAILAMFSLAAPVEQRELQADSYRRPAWQPVRVLTELAILWERVADQEAFPFSIEI
jgi:hypothetical protein